MHSTQIMNQLVRYLLNQSLDTNASSATLDEDDSGFDLSMFSLDKPKHIFQGFKNAVYNLLLTTVVGGLAFVYVPLESSYSGYKSGIGSSNYFVSVNSLASNRAKGLIVGLLKGMAMSALISVLAPLLGFVTASLQLIRGAFNTPIWFGNTFLDDKEWDNEKRQWYNYYLDVESKEILDESEEEHIKKLNERIASENKASKEAKVKRKVKENGYYKLLNVETDASSGEIKKKYYLLARKYHPDKNKSNQAAKEKFQKISEAYQILSDDRLRQQYDLLGKDGVKDEASNNMDPVFMFSFLFGNEKFVNLIGELYYSMLATASVNCPAKEKEDNDFAEFDRLFGGDKAYSEILEYKQTRREVQIAVNLIQRLMEVKGNDLYKLVEEEANELSKDNLGRLLLGFIGYVYTLESHSYLNMFSLSTVENVLLSFLLKFRKYWIITLLILKGLRTFLSSRFSKSEKGEDEQAKDILWKFKDLGITFLWITSLLDVQVTLQNSLRKVFKDKSVSVKERKQRAELIEKIGKQYSSHSSFSVLTSSKEPLKLLLSKLKDIFGDFAENPSATDQGNDSQPRQFDEKLLKAELMKLRVGELKALFTELTNGDTAELNKFVEKKDIVDEILRLQKIA